MRHHIAEALHHQRTVYSKSCFTKVQKDSSFNFFFFATLCSSCPTRRVTWSASSCFRRSCNNQMTWSRICPVSRSFFLNSARMRGRLKHPHGRLRNGSVARSVVVLAAEAGSRTGYASEERKSASSETRACAMVVCELYIVSYYSRPTD